MRRFVLLLWRVFLVIWGVGLPGVRVRAARSGEFALPELLPELFRIIARICVARIDARIF